MSLCRIQAVPFGIPVAKGKNEYYWQTEIHHENSWPDHDNSWTWNRLDGVSGFKSR